MKPFSRTAPLGLALVLACSFLLPSQQPSPAPSLPASFVENRGQWNVAARFLRRVGNERAWLCDDGLWLEREQRNGRWREGVSVHLRFEGGKARACSEGCARGISSWFLGNDRSRWVKGARHFQGVRLAGLYQGVDVVVHEQDSKLEYDLVLEPGADLAAIAVRCEGIERMRIDAAGNLVMETPIGLLVQEPPATWSVDRSGQRHVLACRYELRGGDRFGFAVPQWEAGSELTIDPGLVWATYLGGESIDEITAMDVQANGEVVVAGETTSFSFPVTAGAWLRAFQGGTVDGFVARLAKDGTSLVFCTYLGGDGSDHPTVLDLDANGIATIGGHTTSSNYPTTPDAWRRLGTNDIFVTCLDKAGALLYSTLFGAASGTADKLGGLRADTVAGYFYLAGTAGDKNSFPITGNAYQPGAKGSSDAFYAVLDLTVPNVTGLAYSTFLGGTDVALPERVLDMRVENGIATILGLTDAGDFPVTAGAYQGMRNGTGDDFFVARIDRKLSGSAQLVYGTYLGGSAAETAGRLRLVGSTIVIAGQSASHDFPVTLSAFQGLFAGGAHDGVLALLDPSQQGKGQLAWASFLGGSGDDRVAAMSSNGSVIAIGGETASSDFPVTLGAYQDRMRGSSDGFVALVDPSKSGAASIPYSSFFGGLDGTQERVSALSVDAAAVATFAGTTEAAQFPATIGIVQPLRRGPRDAFVAQLELKPLPVNYTTFGTACTGSAGLPTLLPNELPQMCLPFSVRLNNLRPGVPGAMLLGTSRTRLHGLALPLDLTPFGAPGCWIWTDDTLSFGISTGSGNITWGFTMPYLPAMDGFVFYNQLLYLDFGWNALQVVTTNAGQGVLRR